ncbi:hypothetical protein E2C01_102181 [Portunus trituberculatus]|uniref:Uncharacterized protein n=1 Tax=Portunus trituberculatus TaxID=210409 RepID=A0A5B7KCH3_PORTR|nr:hypothetical protein [Portunus trituberculatus]
MCIYYGGVLRRGNKDANTSIPPGSLDASDFPLCGEERFSGLEISIILVMDVPCVILLAVLRDICQSCPLSLSPSFSMQM